MKKILLIILILSVSIIPIFAEDGIEVNVTNGTINIHGYTMTTIAGRVSAGFFSPINDTINSTIICDDNIVTVVINENLTNQTYQNNCRLNLIYLRDIPLSVNSSYTTIIGDTQLQKNYEDCLVLKAQYSTGLDSCAIEKNKRDDVSTNYTQCTTNLQICNSDKNNALTAKSQMETTQKDTENQKWFFAVGGLVLGLVGMGFYTGKIGGAKINRSEENFNQMQAS